MGRKKKRRVDPGLELARSDTERIRKLSSRAEETDADANIEKSIYQINKLVRQMTPYGPSPALLGLVKQKKFAEARAHLKKRFESQGGERMRAAKEEAEYASQSLKNAPFEMLKLLEAAERKHGKPFRKKKSGRGALLTKEAAERLLRIRNRSK